MNPNMRCNLPGKFWRRISGTARGVFRAANPRPPRSCCGRGLAGGRGPLRRPTSRHRHRVARRDGVVAVDVGRAAHSRRGAKRDRARTSGAALRGLPLARTRRKSRRFWRRVFRLVRIPGGRFLLARFGAPHPAGAAALNPRSASQQPADIVNSRGRNRSGVTLNCDTRQADAACIFRTLMAHFRTPNSQGRLQCWK